MKLFSILTALVLSSGVALAQHVPADTYSVCNSPEHDDKFSLEPSPTNANEYIFKYWNSPSQCSNAYKGGIGVTASDGFRVILYVIVGVGENEEELIYVEPEDPKYMAYPPEIMLPDQAEPGIIRIISGLS